MRSCCRDSDSLAWFAWVGPLAEEALFPYSARTCHTLVLGSMRGKDNTPMQLQALYESSRALLTFERECKKTESSRPCLHTCNEKRSPPLLAVATLILCIVFQSGVVLCCKFLLRVE